MPRSNQTRMSVKPPTKSRWPVTMQKRKADVTLMERVRMTPYQVDAHVLTALTKIRSHVIQVSMTPGRFFGALV
ncbi:hypothetical protein AMTR_s00031p00060000 [Amborella trichopoda]|uniref:Uncharacterized protein n=1 Tax=Amborella trichopoda TaxID=13333 RepID=U5CTB6_AMBTC|nr:hypothetical protein AMTR_s00031p00060000 [Amborella trichopoda]